MVKYLSISSYIRKPFLIYDFPTDPIWTSLYMRKISFSFISVYRPGRRWRMPCLQEAGCRLLAGLTKSNSMIYCLSQINFRIPEAKNAATAPWWLHLPPLSPPWCTGPTMWPDSLRIRTGTAHFPAACLKRGRSPVPARQSPPPTAQHQLISAGALS